MPEASVFAMSARSLDFVHLNLGKNGRNPYGRWKKSQTTTRDVKDPVNNGINYLRFGAGVLLSTVLVGRRVIL